MIGVFIAIFICFLTYIFNYYWNVSKYPKGPFPWPLVGNMLSIPPKNFQFYFEKMAKIHGPVFTIFMPMPMIFVSDYEHLKEALSNQGDTFTHRNFDLMDILQPHPNTGILVSGGDNWKLQRRTSLKILRDFGLGRPLMEEQVSRSVYELLAQLESLENKENVDMFWPIQLCVGNVINESLFGYHFSYKSFDRFKHFVKIVDTHINDQSLLLFLVSAFPILKKVPVIGTWGYERRKENITKYHGFIQAEVEKQVEQFNPDNEPENFVHAYMKQMHENGVEGLDMMNLTACASDFWLAGMETTSNSLRWHLGYIMKYPEVQDKIRKEILEVVGTSRLPTMADKPNLPYTQAVIHEVQRHSNMIPMLSFHGCIKETSIFGHKIPAGSSVIPNVWTIMRNDPVFKDSLIFDPNRFLLEDGKTFNKKVLERNIPFSVGKRNCVGEGLARMELFLIFSALVQKYEFIPNAPIDLTPQHGGVLKILPYTCKLIKQY